MKREDFIFTIGYSGSSPVVDAAGKKKSGKLSPEQLLEAGLFRYAFAAKLFDGGEQESFIQAFNQKSGMQMRDFEQLKRLFGVYEVPENPGKALYV